MDKELLFFFYSGAIINGIVLSVLLFFNQPRSFSNKLLGILLSLFSLELFLVSFFDKYNASIHTTVEHLVMIVLINFSFLYGVLFFLYVKSVVYKDKGFQRRDLWHFIPFVLFILSAITQFALEHSVQNDLVFIRFFAVLFALQNIIGAIYLFLSYRLLTQYKRYSQNQFSNLSRININWLTKITFLHLFLWSISAFGSIQLIFLEKSLINPETLYEVFYLGVSAIVLFAGYYTFRFPETIDRYMPLDSSRKEEKKEKDAHLQEEMEKSQFQHLLTLLEKEKPYLDPDLTLKSLSERSHIPTYLLSKIINQYGNKNFFNFINDFRVEEVKQRLKQRTSEGVLDIALDCGFSSKTTFNTIFKKATGLTPSQFRLN